MESSIRNILFELALPGTTLKALDLLEYIKIDDAKVFLVFRVQDDAIAIAKTWEEAVLKNCQKVCDLEILIVFNKHIESATKNNSGIQGVKHVIAIASGKGGVGKSSVCLNLALAMQKQGLRVGILDTDIYGPSLPTMVGVFEKPSTTDSKKLIPHQKFGLKLMSMGFIAPKDAAIVWRGLMVQSAVGQMLNDVIWDEGAPLDVLLVDMPPGTGDVQLTISQKANLTGAIIVVTSQELALADARRAIKMFEKLNVPIFGVIENMSSFLCPNCKTTTHIFPYNGVLDECEKQNMMLLGSIPIDIAFSESGDIGEPFLERYPNHPISKIFNQIAKTITSQLYA